MNRKFLFIATLFFAGFLLPAHGSADENRVYIVRASGPISPALADFIKNGVKKASDDNAACVIIELDTPGGLAESMRKIVMDILASRIPVAVYVSPSGARAASAGLMITMAADIAAMAPGTNIGAAHPVGLGGKKIDKIMSDKVVNDMAANAKSVAEKRGRNSGWVEKAIRKSVAITETEALKKNVIDMIARDIDDLISQINGLRIKGKGVCNLGDAKKITLKETFRTKILKIISDPNIAYILMMIGLAGLYFELSHPGVLFPGVVGGISIILALFAFQTLPINYAGILLIVAALVFFIMEMKIASYGLLSVAGTIALFLGSVMLFRGDVPNGVKISWDVLLTTLTIVAGFFIIISGLVFRSRSEKPRTGESGLVGEVGVVKKALSPEGKVLTHGEIWNARAETFIEKGTKIRVISVENLVLNVERHQL